MERRLQDLDDLSTWAGEIAKTFPRDETAKMLRTIAARCINAADDI